MADGPIEFVREWLEKAKRDRTAADILIASDPTLTDLAAFHCQQAVEKTLKAFLTYKGRTFEKTHDLSRLCALCADIDPAFDTIGHRADTLSEYAVDFRYPGMDEPTMDNVRDALAVVEEVWMLVLVRLPDDLRQAYSSR